MSIPAAIAPAINGNETSSITKSVFDFLGEPTPIKCDRILNVALASSVREEFYELTYFFKIPIT